MLNAVPQYQHAITIMNSNSLLQALRGLSPTGKDGFEGLLALALARVSGNPMRLAASGHQFGVDGQGEDRAKSMCFEAKKYSSNLSRESVLSKIADLGRRNTEAEILWVLGATVEVPNQLAQDLKTDGEKHGIATLVLDWNNQVLPSLAVTLANAGDDIAAWIASRIKAGISAKKIESDLLELRNSDAAKERWQSLKKGFSSSEISGRQAVEANKSWLRATLSSATTARHRLGQATAPCQPDAPVIRREAALGQIAQSFKEETTCLVLGIEGVGKSWVAAVAALEYSGLAVTLSAEKLEDVKVGGFESLLVEVFAEQTKNATGNLERWKRRLVAWETSPPEPGFLVVIDGINQRPDLPWDKLLYAMECLVKDRGGKLLVTSRPQFYQRHVERGFNRKQRVPIENWDSHERNMILGKASIDPAALDATALASLLNPRLLGIAIDVLPNDDPVVWAGLTVERLLFEHINRTQRDGFEEQSPEKLCAALSDRAGCILDALQNGSTSASEVIFEADLLAVIETRFFQSTIGPKGGYVLKDEGLSLALGFALVDRVLAPPVDEGQFEESTRNLIEPIAALDLTSRVVLAAMHVCADDPERKDSTLFEVLIGAFCELQNLDKIAFPQLLDVVSRNPHGTLSAAKNKLLEWRIPINEKWLLATVKEMLTHAPTRHAVKEAIAEWLRHISIDALDQQFIYGRVVDGDKEQAAKRQKEIDDAIAAFSSYEQELYNRCLNTKGNNDALLTQSLKLLAGEPLAPWAQSFAIFGLGVHLNRNTLRASRTFSQLVHYNRVDPVEAGQAYLEVGKPFRAPEISRAGRWCLVKLLYATGRENDAKEAFALRSDIRKAQNFPDFYFPRREIVCSSDPCDPNSERPENVALTIERFGGMDVTPIMATMSYTTNYRNYKEALCAVSRFGPCIAVSKGSELCRSILTREGIPLRQLAVCGTTLAPLKSRKDALGLSQRLRAKKGLETLTENDLKVVKCYMTNFALPHLTEEEQLELLSAESLAGLISLEAIPSFAKPNEQAVLNRLAECVEQQDGNAAFSTLYLVAHTYEELSEEIENSIVRLMEHESGSVRGAVFTIAHLTGNKCLRTAHLNSDWTVCQDSSSECENTYGSALLIDAVVNGDISFEEILPRISHESWSFAQSRLGGQVTDVIVSLLDARLRKATAFSPQLDPPEVKVNIAPRDHILHGFRSVEEREIPSSLDKMGSIFGESLDDFLKRQGRTQRLFDEMKRAMSDKDILVITQTIDFESFKDILGDRPILGLEWTNLLLSIPDNQLPWFKDFAIAIAANTMSVDEVKAIQLLRKAISSDGFIRHIYPDGLSLEQKAIWSCSPNDSVEVLWQERLATRDADDLLALEVLAAERFGGQGFIRDYTEWLLTSNRPVDRALAITIAGFSGQLEFFGSILNDLETSTGFVGSAVQAAKVAHEKALWSLHWVDRMWKAESPADFWLNMNLANKIMDARLDYDSSIYRRENKWHGFASILTESRKDRVKKWNRVRAKTLYGNHRPYAGFLAANNAHKSQLFRESSKNSRKDVFLKITQEPFAKPSEVNDFIPLNG